MRLCPQAGFARELKGIGFCSPSYYRTRRLWMFAAFSVARYSSRRPLYARAEKLCQGPKCVRSCVLHKGTPKVAAVGVQ